MRELDPRAQRELGERIAKDPWFRRSKWRRLAVVLAGASPTVLIGAVILYLAIPEWWWTITLAGLAVLMLILLPYVFFPEAFLRHSFRAWYVSDEDAHKSSTVP